MQETDIDGRYNDRTVFVESDLYLSRGEYFSPGQWLAADGIFEGDGNCGVSYTARQMHGDLDKRNFNLAFTEIRKYIDTAFGRVQSWFPLLRNKNAEWNYNDSL